MNIRLRVLPQILPVDGREVELQVTETHIQWRYTPGDDAWVDLIALSELIGPEGPSTEFQVGGDFIQYRTIGDEDWIDLVALGDITGPQGDEGPQGEPGPPVADGDKGGIIVSSAGTDWQIKDGDKGDVVVLADGTSWVVPKLADGDKGDVTLSDDGALWKINEGIVAGVLYGMTMANDVTFPDHGIVVASGSTRSIEDDVGIILSASKLKRMNLAWSTGTGGLDTGSIAANTSYHVYAIYNPTTDDSNVIGSLSATNPLMPSGYTSKRRIGSFVTDGSGIIRPFVQIGGWFMLKTPVNLSAWGNLAGGTPTLKASGAPLGVKVRVRISIATTSTTAGYVSITDPDRGAIAVNQNAAYYQPASVLTGATVEEWTNASGQVYAAHGGANATTSNIFLQGWYDIRDTSV